MSLKKREFILFLFLDQYLKNMISNTYNRYLWLLNTLLIYKRITFKEIKEKWKKSYLYEGQPLSLRTFHSHRKAIEEMFQVSIECDTSNGYKYYVDDAEILDHDKARKWLLSAFNVGSIISEGKSLRDRIQLEDAPQGTEFLGDIIDAIRNNIAMGVEYQPFYNEQATVYHVEAYCLKMYRQRWYVLGRCRELDGLRHFSLDRILSIHKTDNTFCYPKDFSPESYYKDVVGIWTNESLKAERITIRAYGLQSKYLLTLPLHPSQKEIASHTHYTDFSYHLCITNNLVCELLAKGSAVEVLEPESLRKRILQEVSTIIDRYKFNPKKSL